METTEDTTLATDDTEHPESRLERLANELEKTNALMIQTFSYKTIIIRGLITGVAIVAGSTILASILLSALRLVFGDIPLPW